MDSPESDRHPLPEKAQDALLEMARGAIARAVNGLAVSNDPPAHEALETPGAAFVTVSHEGRLRGCRGCLEWDRPLWEAVRTVAVDAALRDPRFPLIQPEELDEVRVKMSVLSPLVPLERPEGLEVGRHGLLIRKGWAGGLLLPEVPVRYGWDPHTYLGQVCRKANLPEDAWRDPEARLWVFETEEFGQGL